MGTEICSDCHDGYFYGMAYLRRHKTGYNALYLCHTVSGLHCSGFLKNNKKIDES